MKQPFALLYTLLLLSACGSPKTPTLALKAESDSYFFSRASQNTVAKDKGLLVNDTLPNQTVSIAVGTKPLHGTLVVAQDGSFTYQHDGNQAAEDGFTYTLKVGNISSSAKVTLSIQDPPPSTPLPTDDAYTLNEGASVQIEASRGLLANDQNPLETALSVSLQKAPEHGTLDLKTDGSFSYAHNHSETTQDSFEYIVSNGQKSSQARVILTINPVDDVPSIGKLELAQTHPVPAEGRSWSGDKLAKYNLHLAGGRKALVLVDIASANNRVTSPVLEVWQAGQKQTEVPLNPPASLYPTESSGPAYSTTAYWATLEANQVQVGLELVLRANEGQRTAARAVKVGATAPFNIYTLPFYLFGLNESHIPLSSTAAPDQAIKDEYFAKHPFSSLEIVNHPVVKVQWPYIVVAPRQGRPAQKVEYKEQQGDGYAVMSAVLNTLGAIRGANGDGPLNNHYYAPLLMANQAGNYSGPGGGLGGGDLGTGDHSYTGIFIHEQGHAFGMPHANDGYQGGSYPYIGGSLKGSSWGFDQINNRFLGTFVPSNSSRYKNCAGDGFVIGRQFDELGRCIKQDPMQSGSGDQAAGYKYTMFSDFNASLVQHYLEGTTTLSGSKHSYSGGTLFLDPTSSTGYSRWDSLEQKMVAASTQTSSGGIYELDQGLPLERGVPVHSIILTASIASIQDTYTEVAGQPQLSYLDTITYDPTLTQIYPPLSYTGNLRRQIDPTDPAQLASIVPNTSTNYWYCLNSGCDYSLRITYTDNSLQYVVLHGGFKRWYDYDIKPTAANSTDSDSYKVWGVNVPGYKALKKIELLETPEVWKGLPANPRVIASRTLTSP